MHTYTLLFNLQQQQQNGLNVIFSSVLHTGPVRTDVLNCSSLTKPRAAGKAPKLPI